MRLPVDYGHPAIRFAKPLICEHTMTKSAAKAAAPTVNPILEPKTCRANGVDFAYLEVGEGPLVLCLHGFPDTAWGFSETLVALAAAGFRAVAPFMRGYAPTGLAPDGDYSVLALAQDIVGLIDAFGEKDAIVVGHDWGGLAAYTAANLQPSRIRKLVVMCVPHVAGATTSLAQLKRSWYVWFFQLPYWPQRELVKRNFRFIDTLYRNWSPSWRFTSQATDPVKKALASSDATLAALGYYRAMVRGSTRKLRSVMSQRTLVPSLVMAGEQDGAIGIEQFDNARRAYGTDFQFKRFSDAGHFPHRECFEEYIAELLAFIKG
jgi:pimeloyl-ACP methyl ester carboxylesterase